MAKTQHAEAKRVPTSAPVGTESEHVPFEGKTDLLELGGPQPHLPQLPPTSHLIYFKKSHILYQETRKW